MSDTKESMPAQPKTTEIEAPPAWAISMSEKIARGFADTNARLSGIETTVDTLVEDGKAANQRMTRIEVRMDTLEGRASTQSERVKGESEVNLKQDAALAQVIVRVDGVEKKLDELTTKTDAQTQILTRLETGAKALAANPKVQLLAGILWTALLGYLASKGLVSK